MANHSGQIDTLIEIVTPENIAFQYRVAGPFYRLPAYLIDVVIRVVAAFFALAGFSLIFGIFAAPGIGLGLGFVVWFVLEWLYGGLFETFWNGQTPGKRLMRLRVVSVDGQPINAFQAVLRNILRAVDALPAAWSVLVTYQLGLVASMMNDRFQRLGDLACGTMVIVEEPTARYGVVRVSEPDAIRLAAELPRGFQASRSLALTLSSYVSKRRRFGWSRRVEIARHLAEPLRIRFGLPPETSPDLLLCAAYHRTFFAESVEEEAPLVSHRGSAASSEQIRQPLGVGEETNR